MLDTIYPDHRGHEDRKKTRMAQMEGTTGWEKYQELVLNELKRLTEGQEDMSADVAQLRIEIAKIACRDCPYDNEAITQIRVELAGQKVRTGILATVFGTLSGVISSLIAFLMKN